MKHGDSGAQFPAEISVHPAFVAGGAFRLQIRISQVSGIGIIEFRESRQPVRTTRGGPQLESGIQPGRSAHRRAGRNLARSIYLFPDTCREGESFGEAKIVNRVSTGARSAANTQV